MLKTIKRLYDWCNTKTLALSVALFTSPAMASQSKYSTAITEVKAEFDSGETAVGAVMASTVEIFVVRRVWRIIRSSI